MQASTSGVETAVHSAVAQLFRLPGGDGPGGYSPLPGRELDQLQLPFGLGGFGLQTSSELDAHAAFLSGAASAQLVMAGGVRQFRPFDNAGVARLRQIWRRVFDDYSGDCGWPEAARALSADTVVPRYSRLGYSRISVIVGFFARTNVHYGKKVCFLRYSRPD
jgi:hypothetical protein